MRLWSLHPQCLDSKGLVALWREGLLAQAVLSGKTRGYRHHPQLTRFLQSPAPREYVAAYLRSVHAEAIRRGYRFDAGKIDSDHAVEPLSVTRGQLDYEWKHLRHKLGVRAPDWLAQLEDVELPEPHPLFQVVPGDIAEWEVVTVQQAKRCSAPPARKRD
ncbi:MAG TPA: pyrimidine dimer DNA glycosylase/endonuclease V [Gammaproteobacteria bacterium]|nr:pyrimidine dimer DNA glycosylase/endonuclease V [Gammaproteobacteria bacterium]